MRFLSCLVCLLAFSCSYPDSIAEEINILDDVKLVFAKKTDMSVPEDIPSSFLPITDQYHIQTRIVIEGQFITTDVYGEPVIGTWWARTPEDVKRDLVHVEETFSEVGIKLHVEEFIYREYVSDAIDNFIDASKHPSVLTIIYMLPKNFHYDGYSTAPWELMNRGIVIGYLADEWTLAHEVGHYFGLLHTFTNDLVDDTPEQEEEYCLGETGATPNCQNIMSYCIHAPKCLTGGQAERVRRFLRASRRDHLLSDYPDVLLQGQEFPVLPGLKVTFNLVVKGTDVSIDREESPIQP